MNVIILGAGKIGSAIAKHLSHSGDFTVTVGDKDEAVLLRLKGHIAVKTVALDVAEHDQLVLVFKQQDLVISACSFNVNPGIAQAALEAGASYFDLTEDVATTEKVRAIAAQAKAGQIFMPQCGLAPGFISILANDLCQGFDSLQQIKMRVGALPQFPSNMMMYNLTWSTDGLINEYCNPCESIIEGERVKVLPLEGLERFSMDGIDYEAFNTSGGLGTLCETLDNKVDALDYKTVRYEGHCYLMAFLTQSLGLGQRREILKNILEKAVPITLQDVVLVFCSVTGMKNGQLTQVTDARKIYHCDLYDEHWSSIQLTTASAMCAVVDLFRLGKLPSTGFVKQEEVSLEAFLGNRFGQHYISH